jgi:hypothetical protein
VADTRAHPPAECRAGAMGGLKALGQRRNAHGPCGQAAWIFVPCGLQETA